MAIEVTVVDDIVNIKPTRNLDGTECIRLDMSNRTVAFLPVAREHGRSSLVFPLEVSLMSKPLWRHLKGKLVQKVREQAKKLSETPPRITINEVHAIAFRIGHQFNVIFDVIVVQDGVSLPTTQRLGSDPITIARVSAATIGEARRTFERRKR